ncbi:MAG: L,D-transpeptidase [Mycobacteriaceae bacterium]|nr:L,D-transpeptidase [Mycobacteriaceae bacterium]
MGSAAVGERPKFGRTTRCVVAVMAAAVVAVAVPANTASAAASTPTSALTVRAFSPAPGEVVGIGEPLVITFSRPVADRAVAERALTINAPERPSGQFEWLDDETLQFKPTGFWPAHSDITVTMDGFKTDVTTGAGVVGVASISTHRFKVSIDGSLARDMPASMGKPSRPTPVGSFTVLDRNRTVVMDSRTIGIPLSSPEGYLITASYAERITNSGVYVHSAPWSVDSQGNANVSHGCINLSPDNAAWYYNTVHVGDPVIVES